MIRLPIRTPYITLKDVLKISGLAITGGMVKQILQDGDVRVNSSVEVRRGRKLYPGDTVECGPETVIIVNGVEP